jgi:hypothetical protein
MALCAHRLNPSRAIYFASARAGLVLPEELGAKATYGADTSLRLVESVLERLAVEPEWNPLLLVDDLPELLDPALDDAIERLVNLQREAAFALVVSSGPADLRQAYSGCLSHIRKARKGILLTPDLVVDGDIFNVTLSRTHIPSSVGRGYLVDGPEAVFLQLGKPG